MLILDADKVNFCRVFIDEANVLETMPGVSYQDRIFTLDYSFPMAAHEDAVRHYQQVAANMPEEAMAIIVKEKKQLSIWKENSLAQIVSYPLEDIDLARLVSILRNEKGIEISDRRHNLTLYERCFVGSEAVQWFATQFNYSQQDAVLLGQRLIDEQWIHHVTHAHQFEDAYLFYRFFIDEDSLDLTISDTSITDVETIDLADLVAQMRNVGGVRIKNRWFNGKPYPNCFRGDEAVLWFTRVYKLMTEDAIRLGQRLIDEQWIHHVKDEHLFEDATLFYRFYWDEDNK